MKAVNGFTLVELMIVIAIIGILASIALPSYRDYTIRAKISEALVVTSAAKTHVSEYYITIGQMPTNITSSGLDSTETSLISAIEYAKTSSNISVITAKLKAIDNTISLNDSYLLTGTGSASGVTWACTTNTLPARYLPAACR